MNWPQLKKSWMYDMLSIVSNKPTNTLKKYFSRNKLDITNKNHVCKYLSKYSHIKAKNKVKSVV